MDIPSAKTDSADIIDRPSVLMARLAELGPGIEVEITPALFDYFLDVLPPGRQGADWFWFAEGADTPRQFREVRATGRAFCKIVEHIPPRGPA